MAKIQTIQDLEAELRKLRFAYNDLDRRYASQQRSLETVIDFAEKLEARLCTLEKPFDDVVTWSEASQIAQ